MDLDGEYLPISRCLKDGFPGSGFGGGSRGHEHMAQELEDPCH
jgi:hypothetical protein